MHACIIFAQYTTITNAIIHQDHSETFSIQLELLFSYQNHRPQTVIAMKLLITSILLTTAQGFVVPSNMNVVVEKLVDVIPPIGQNDPLELAMKTALVPFILYAPFSMQSRSSEEVPAPIEDEIDFDAPLERQLKVDHIVRRQPYTLGLGDMGTVVLPSFLQQALGLYQPEKTLELPDIDEQYFNLIHDECYRKDLTAHDCVDFDPVHKSTSQSH